MMQLRLPNARQIEEKLPVPWRGKETEHAAHSATILREMSWAGLQNKMQGRKEENFTDLY